MVGSSKVHLLVFLIGLITLRSIPSTPTRLSPEEIPKAPFVCPDLNGPPPPEPDEAEPVSPLRQIFHFEPSEPAIGTPSTLEPASSSQSPIINGHLSTGSLSSGRGETDQFIEQRVPSITESQHRRPLPIQSERITRREPPVIPNGVAQDVQEPIPKPSMISPNLSPAVDEPIAEPPFAERQAKHTELSGLPVEPRVKMLSHKESFVEELPARAPKRKGDDLVSTNNKVRSIPKQKGNLTGKIQKSLPSLQPKKKIAMRVNVAGSSTKDLQSAGKAIDRGQSSSKLNRKGKAKKGESSTPQEPPIHYRPEWLFRQLNSCNAKLGTRSGDGGFWIPREDSEEILETYRKRRLIFPVDFDDDVRREALARVIVNVAYQRLDLSGNLIMKNEILKPMNAKIISVSYPELSRRRMKRIDKIIRYVESVSTLTTFLIITYLTLFREHQSVILTSKTVDDILIFIAEFWRKIRTNDTKFLDKYPWAKGNINIINLSPRKKGVTEYSSWVYQKRCQLALAWHILDYWIEKTILDKKPALCWKNSNSISQLMNIMQYSK
ncbi:hypothetical protein Pst134EA_027121 [Puccinia striiformis f. sp. tritici]|uniref:hypothetical protein n=1 Tax=Puccinia striiformis f. sp. tritici TaxID=168172 RepID=UPI002008C36F|nr:hypothetical protein Pst134EA_027121 [Puccinia striiformis f. sp. tritici]KAH9450420.1 hypothetical protein Pst134EA_027121 [Puccinia striiformis f. sp. tritici]